MFNQKQYIQQYDKNNYIKHVFRVRKDDMLVNNHLKTKDNINSYILDLIRSDTYENNNVVTIKQIKNTIVPILNSYGIKEIYLFGSYARGEANANSDIDIYCERGNIDGLEDVFNVRELLKEKLNKDIDLLFNDMKYEEIFENNIKRDLIKLC